MGHRRSRTEGHPRSVRLEEPGRRLNACRDAENDLVEARVIEPARIPICWATAQISHTCMIHRQLLQDIYVWAEIQTSASRRGRVFRAPAASVGPWSMGLVEIYQLDRLRAVGEG